MGLYMVLPDSVVLRFPAYPRGTPRLERDLALEARGHLYARECSAQAWYAKGACLLRDRLAVVGGNLPAPDLGQSS
jgi:hypothetical protein